MFMMIRMILLCSLVIFSAGWRPFPSSEEKKGFLFFRKVLKVEGKVSSFLSGELNDDSLKIL